MSKKTITVEVVYGLPQHQVLLSLKVPLGTTALEAVHQSDIAEHFPAIDMSTAKMGIFSNTMSDPASYTLKEGDRVEIYRPLTADPKEVRRRRAAEARSRRADS